ncbi:MAG: ABC transporter permease DevC [Snowella sp.]|nr:ABC transporter permease DevC [Snowella sp.]
MIKTKIPVAWLQLKFEKGRLLAGLAGISFAVILMFMQLGFQAALFDSSVHIHKSLKADLILISPRSTSLIAMKSFSKKRLYQALKFPEVSYVSPLYLGFAQWQNPSKPRYWRNIHIIGFDIRYPIFELPEFMGNYSQLSYPNVVFFDSASRPEYGPIIDWFKAGKLVETEIDNLTTGSRKVSIVNTFRLGTSFGIDGNLVTSHLNFLRIFSERQSGLIEVGLIKLKDGINIKNFKQNLRFALPNDVDILTKQEWIDFEKNYWMSSTAIGFIFALGVGMGLIVGIVVVYQILYTDITQHLPEYATLMAIGYQNAYFVFVILQESLILATMGYIPGFLITSILYNIARNITLLPIFMTAQRSLFVFFLTLVMCCLSGMVATRQLRDADPADIF